MYVVGLLHPIKRHCLHSTPALFNKQKNIVTLQKII